MIDSQDETSEAFIGEWAEKRGIRDQLVIATKVLFIIIGFVYLLIVYPLSILPISSEETRTLSSKRCMSEIILNR